MTKHKKHEQDETTKQAEQKPDTTSAEAEATVQQQPSAQEEQKEPQPETQPSLQEEIAKLQADIEAAKDRELRCLAELDNFRKRAARELEEHARYSEMALLRDLLPVLDNMERAIEAGEKAAEATSLLEGFKLVRQQLEDVLKKHNCIRIEALHKPFDPNLHHAVLQQPSEEFPPNTVLMITQNGYQLYDRIVRPCQVIVSTAKTTE